MAATRAGNREVVLTGVIVLPPGAVTFEIVVDDLLFKYTIYDMSLTDKIPVSTQSNPKIAEINLFTQSGVLATSWDSKAGNYRGQTLWQSIIMHILDSTPSSPVREIVYTFATGVS